MWTERSDDPNAKIRREKEARSIRDFIRNKLPPENNPSFLITGDFNDHKNRFYACRQSADKVVLIKYPVHARPGW